MKGNLPAHLALFGANLIYGINYTVAKDVMPDYVKPFGFIFLRAVGALLLFWTVHRIAFREKIQKEDIPRLILCGMFGVAINQLLFFKGLNITTPINAAIIMTSNPILVLVASSIMLRERITTTKISGIALGLTGALALLLFKENFSFGSETLFGDFLILINAASYGVYLVLVKPLMMKYQPLTVIKWVFLFGFCFVLPFSVGEASEIEWSTMPTYIWWEIAFVVVFTTFFAYLLNIFALKQVSPTTASTYIYLQPLLAAIVALALGKDSLDWIKVAATLLIFAGVYLVSKPAKTIG